MRKPVLAKSGNRTMLAKKHPYAGGPEDWIKSTISFDFFINWSSNVVESEIWVKRILNVGEVPPDTEIEKYLEMYNEDFINISNFAQNNNEDLHYILFDDTQNWSYDESILFDLHIVNGEWIKEEVNLKNIKNRIYNLSGGEIKIGSKGLIYSTSNLEAALSYTSYLWPGDVDAIVLGKSKQPVAILEYRKHTRKTNYESVCIYYNNGKDRRKYDRLQLLKNTINPSLPLIVVTYPTLPKFDYMFLECIDVDLYSNSMKIIASSYCDLPNEKDKNRKYNESIVNLINQWNGYYNKTNQ